MDAQTIANSIKADGIRIVGVAIGSDANIDNFKAITGPDVSPSPIAMGATTDIVSTTFDLLDSNLAQLSGALCSNTITVQVQVDTNNDGVAEITGNEADDLLADYSFCRTGPNASPEAIRSCDLFQGVGRSGSLQYSSLQPGNYSIAEFPRDDYEIASISCKKDGATVGIIDPLFHRIVSNIPLGQGENASCTFLNKLATTPEVPKAIIGLKVSVLPTGVPIGGGTVIFTYVVTNPGPVVLTDVGLTDKQCSPVSYVSGDTNVDSALQNTESWKYTCSKTVTAALTNDATVTGKYLNQTATAQGKTSVTKEAAKETVTAPGSASVSIIPAGPPKTGR